MYIVVVVVVVVEIVVVPVVVVVGDKTLPKLVDHARLEVGNWAQRIGVRAVGAVEAVAIEKKLQQKHCRTVSAWNICKLPRLKTTFVRLKLSPLPFFVNITWLLYT